MISTVMRISLSICLAVIVSGPLSAQKEKFTYYAVNTGGVNRPDLEAHLGSAAAKEVGVSLGPKMVSARGLVVILALVTNKNRSEPLHVSPSSAHLKLPSGEIYSSVLCERNQRSQSRPSSLILYSSVPRPRERLSSKPKLQSLLKGPARSRREEIEPIRWFVWRAERRVGPFFPHVSANPSTQSSSRIIKGRRFSSDFAYLLLLACFPA
jgi:hypothetical protein